MGVEPLLIHSNAPWSPTGYGNQTGLFAPKLSEHYRTGVSAFYGLEGSKLFWESGIPVYPGLGGDYGNVSLVPNAVSHFAGNPKGGLVLSLLDVWVLKPQVVKEVNMASWVPVDHEPAPPRVYGYFEQTGAVPIAMSKFGQEQLAPFDPLYVPHAVDTSVYKPMDKAEAREALNIPKDKFLVGMVAANKGIPPRKCFQEALIAFRDFNDRHDDSVMYLHSELSGRFEGVNLYHLIEAIEMPPQAMSFPDQDVLVFDPLPPQAMAVIYSAMDVLLAASAGEGFGIPVLEAQACGTPAIVTDFSAQKEVCGAGWHVQWEPVWTPQESWQAKPDISDIIEALEKAYALSAEDKKRMSAQAVEHAAQYDIDVVMEKHMLPALEEAASRIADRPVELVP